MPDTGIQRARLLIVIVLAVLLGALAASAAEDVYQPQQKLRASDGATADRCGTSLAVDGAWAVLGSPGADTEGRDSGAAYVFRDQLGTWTQVAKLVASDGQAGDEFGQSVALRGRVLMVGAPGAGDRGAVYVFKRAQDAWTERSIVLDPAGGIGDRFGTSLSLGEDRLAVGSPRDDDAGLDAGSCHLYRLDGQNWLFEQSVTAPSTTTGDEFGASLSIFGARLLVGAPGDDDYCGSAQVFVWTGSAWEHEQALRPSDGAPADRFGDAVTMDGDSIAVGAWLDDDQGSGSGSVTIFRDTGSSWTQDQKLQSPNGAAGDHYGRAVWLDGDRVLVGAPGADGAGTVSGAVYVHLERDDTFESPQRLLDPDGDAWDELGSSVAVQGSLVLVGAPSDDAASGSVSVFDVPPPNPLGIGDEQNLLVPSVHNLGIGGYVLASDGDFVAVGGSELDEGDLNGDGDSNDVVMHVYDLKRERLRNLRLAASFAEFYRGRLLFFVSEFGQGADLNGDGDTDDFSVLHVFDPATWTLTNTQVAASAESFYGLGGGFVPLLVSEDGQGLTDLNGDGDTADFVFHTYELATGTLRNHQLASWSFGPSSDTFISVSITEAGQGDTDLNGDGDATDTVVQPFFVPTAGMSGFPIAGWASAVSEVGTFLSVPESQQGNTDLNEDGDTGDTVAHFDYFDSGSIDNLYHSASFWSVLRNDFAACSVDEASDGRDYNGDGDQLDQVVHSYHYVSGLRNHAVAGTASMIWDDRALIFANETSQGGVDLNDDGDAMDTVPMMSPRNGTATSLGIASNIAFFSPEESFAVFSVSEASQGNTDLNGDGDTFDLVLAGYGFQTDRLRVIPRAHISAPLVQRPYTLFQVSEASSSQDLNGDGDTLDRVVALDHFGQNRLFEPGLAVDFSMRLQGSRAVVSVPESAHGNTDLNGDGDASDSVLHVLFGESSRVANLRLAGTVVGYPTSGHVFAQVREAWQGEDLNGDGDQLDSVVFLIEL